MTITLNGEAIDVAAPATIADLLVLRFADPRPQGIAVAVNDDVVPRGDWTRRPLADHDVVEIVTAVQGG